MSRLTAGEDIEAVYEEIGRRIRWVRESQRKTASSMAQAVGTTVSTVSGWELGMARLRVAELVLICNYLEVKPNVLLDALRIEDCRITEKQRAARQERGQRTSRYFAANRVPDGQQKKAAPKAKKKGKRP